MLILDLWGISFHAVIFFGLGKNLLFKSVLGRCGCLDANDVCHKRNINRKVKCLIWHNDRARERKKERKIDTKTQVSEEKILLPDENVPYIFLRGGMK